MEENESQRSSTPADPPRTNAGDGSDHHDRSDPTIAGQIVKDLGRATRPIATAERRSGAQVAAAAQRERIAGLISALGDPVHPLHQRAVDDLVAIGPPAVNALCDALNPQRPWLTAYRAAEALGRIGDGRGSSRLIETLRHPNSNVRWSAIRALASVGDARALMQLQRVARTDQSRTSWGEPVGGTAQSVLEEMQGRNILLRAADLIKTAAACVFMLVALILAWSFVTTLRDELRQIGKAEQSTERSPIVRTAIPTIPQPTPLIQPTLASIATGATTTPQVTNQPTAATEANVVNVIASGNVRGQPTRAANNVIGAVSEGDQVVVLATTPDQQWYRIALGERHAATSRINSDNQSGWVARSLLSPVAVGSVPVEALPTAVLPTSEPPLAPPTQTPSP